MEPQLLPYNEKMARKYILSDKDTEEDARRRHYQAESSRLCRHRTKYVENCLEADIPNLQRVLHQRIKRLVEMEDFVNGWFLRSGVPTTDFKAMWDDDCQQTNVEIDKSLSNTETDESEEVEVEF